MSEIREPGTGESVLLEGRDLVQEFDVRGRRKDGTRRVVQALSGVSLTIRPGETLGIVGETGSGKSTLARAVMASPRPKAGEVLYRGQDLLAMNGAELRQARRGIQMVHQDPFDSLDPNWTAVQSICEPLNAYRVGSRAERRARALDIMKLVGLDPDRHADRRPRQLSGGQCQRVAIARALALSPELIICDEAVSSLDVLVQAQVLNLFEELRSRLNLSYLFIAHDLAMVKQISDRVGVMYLGKLVEVSDSVSLFRQPRHPYTAALLGSIPAVEPGAGIPPSAVLHGEMPSAIDPPSGCRFRTRCPRAGSVCAEQEPELSSVAEGQSVACHFPLGTLTARTREAEVSPRAPPGHEIRASPSIQ